MKLSLRPLNLLSLLSLALWLFCLSLSACSHKQPAASAQAALIQNLEQRGVELTTVGETVTLVLPSDELFVINSANVKPKYRPVLEEIAKLLQTYTLVSIKVIAYSDDTKALDLQALTTKQAQRVANALWGQGINARLIYAEGGANSDLVVKSGSHAQRSSNRRVEIRFRYYLPVSYYD